MYQMALDQIPQEENIGFKVCRNIGNDFVNIENYRDAIKNYETAMSFSPEHENAINALLYYVVLGDAEKSKQCFTKIMSLPLNQAGEEINICKGGERCGDLHEKELLHHS